MKLNHKKVIKVDLVGKQEGFIHADGKKMKLPFKDNEVTLLMAANLVNKIEPKKFVKWMNECWRILKEDGQFLIQTPYAGSVAYWADPENINGCNAQTWHYFDPESQMGLYHLYKPKPWKVDRCAFQVDGIMEVLLIKRNDKRRTKK